jgi:hypothetical protein
MCDIFVDFKGGSQPLAGKIMGAIILLAGLDPPISNG